MKQCIYVSLLCMLTLFQVTAQAQDANGILYVKKGSTGTGVSWADPLGELADALKAATQLNAATAGTVKQIWVVAGTYLPMYPADAVTTGTATTTDRTNAFVLVNDVKIYGGFAGTETALTSRDSSRVTNQTILSGNLGGTALATDNAQRVVIAAGAVGAAEINSFIVREGYGSGGSAITVNGINIASGLGAGIVCYGAPGNLASPVIANVTSTANTNATAGGGLYCNGAAPVINDVIISENSAGNGGGMFSTVNTAPVLHNVVISGNSAINSGGGIYILNPTALAVLSNVVIKGNTASGNGGGVYNTSAPTSFTNVLMSGNKAGSGGGLYNISAPNIVLTNVTVAGNVASSSGGGLFYNNNTPKLYNCIIYGNSASTATYAGIYPSITPSTTCQYNLVQGAVANATYHIQSGNTVDPAFTGASTATAPFTDGDYSLQSSSPAKNAGNDALYTAILDYPTTDLAGSARFNGTIDLGAYEVPLFQPQTITALADTTVTYGAVFTRAFATSSGLTVSLSSADNSVAEVYQDAGDNNIWKIKAKKIGSVVITMSQAGNASYAAATDKSFTLTVNQADLTVTANGSLITYTGASFSGGNGITYTGFVNGDDSTSALTGTLTYSGTSQGVSSVGTYVITPGGLNATNYTISYADGSLSIVLATNANGVLFVKKGSTGNGSSWANATGEVATALRAGAIANGLTAGTVKQIWVAKGTYLPMYPANNVAGGTSTTTNQINSFVLLKDVKIYGGFAGTETDTAARDFTSPANTSILSGDLGAAGDISDNAFHVLLAGGNMGNAVISGFTVTGGNAGTTAGSTSVNGYSFGMGYGGGISMGGTVALFMEDMTFSNNTGYYGGAISVNGSNPSNVAMVGFRRVNVLNNTSLNLGGAVYLAFSTVDIDSANVSFNTCTGNYAGGMFVSYASNVNATRLHVNDNNVTGTSAVGGGIYVSNSSTVNMTNSELLRDTATTSGALLYENSTTAQVFKNVKMSGGLGGSTGSVVYCSPSTNMTYINTLISGNAGLAVYMGSGTHNFINTTISGNGTGIYPFGGTVTIQNSIIYGNTTEGIQSGSATVNIQYSTIQGATDDATNYITSANPLFKSPSSNTAPFTNGDYSLQSSSPVKDAGNDVLYTVVSGYPTTDLAGSARFDATIDQGAYEVSGVQGQTITALADTTVLYGQVFTRAFSASSGLTVALSSADNSIAEVYQDASDNNIWKMKAKKAGVVLITMSQAGNAGYTAAADVTFSLTISKAALTIKANDSTVTYAGTAFSGGNGVAYSGLVNGDDSTAALTGLLTYSGTSQGAKNVNTYVITPGGLSAANYTITYTNGTLTIGKAALTVTAKDSSKVYDGLVFNGGNGLSYSGFVNSEDSTAALTGAVTYSGTSQGAKNVNTYVITPAGLSAANYTITYANGTLTIGKAALTVTAKDSSKVYDGVAYNGGNGLSYSGFVNSEDSTAALTGAVTYSGTSQGAKNVNTYVITPAGLSAANYTITYANGTLTIGKAALTVTAKDSSKVYDGLSYNGGNGLSYSGFVNSEDSTAVLTGAVTYSGTSQGAKSVNTYVITPGGLSAANYTITYANGTLTIDKAALTVTAKDSSKVYDGIGYSGGNGLSYSGFVNSEDSTAALTGAVTYSGTSQGAKNVNAYVITPGGLSAANYAITYANGTLTIGKASLTVTAKDSSKVYDGVAYSGGNGLSYSGFVNSEDSTAALTGAVTYSGTSQGAKNVNTYVITPGGLSAANYTITYANGTLTIGKAALTVTAKDSSKVYDGVAYSGGNGLSYSGFVNSEDSATALTGAVTYSGTSQGAKNVNAYVITPGGLTAGNYTITYADGTLTIGKAALTVTAKDSSKVYDGLAYSGGNGLSYSGFVNSEDSTAALTGAVTYSGTSQGAKNVNAYVITPDGLTADNYDITYADGTLTIGKAALTITAQDSSKVYDGVAYSGGNGLSYSGFVNSEDSAAALTGAVTYSGTSQGAKNVNTYVITPGGLLAGNYDITYANGSLAIIKAALTVTAKDSTKVYDATAFAGGNNVSYNGFVSGEDSTAALTGAVTYSGTSQGAENVNTYVITPGGLTADNYAISYVNGILSINKALVTITAADSARCYGIANPVFRIIYSGLAGNETESVFTNAAQATTTATTQSAAGTYAITVAGAAADNYSFAYTNGALTVNALPVSTISAGAGTVLCGVNGTRVLSASGNYSFEWLFNGTAVQGNATDTILVSATGTYTAAATDNNGCVAPATNSLAITRLLPAQPAFSYDSYCAGTAVQFSNETNVVNSGTVSYSWTSGDGQNSSDAAPQFTYLAAGNYTAALTVTPDVCPSLAATVTKVIPVVVPVTGEQLATVNTTAGLPTTLAARQLTNASYSWSPSTGLSATNIYNPVTTLGANQLYNIRMDFPSGCVTVDTLLVTAFVTNDILVPNVFTPNGDGQNDLLYANLRGVKQLNYFRVFNRWGKKVFETADVNKGWDGRVNGELQPLATYVWTAEGVDENGRTMHRQGSVTLLR
ncbi:gliding motility-associated C-terminal domain-containing protein [Filimonas lacunae]|uniref:Gliding motility-associated C-terminal domain-containing protein n=1 Tax=Filimonas lacunae TaxID=477680 RepID=A0A173MI26_9BACT|nr:MBG domain-containing protein [Filimonas lacunae]BAV07136.1 flagellar hook-length control protein FliK [Filimonas lacunae]SIS94492.1 gliding motility-associated C-terminal domain-containing protein [Filimonas lacunae]